MRNKIYLFFALLWTAIVAVLCLISSDKLPMPHLEKNFDKLGHLSFHFGITSLWFLYFKRITENSKNALLKAFLFSVFFGIAIEISQALFTTTRRADFFDVIANTFGAILSIGFILFFKNKTNLLISK